MTIFLFENHPFLVSSYPYNSAEEKSGLFSEANFAQDFFQFFMSHYPLSPFGKRYKITLRVITCLFVEGYGILVYQIVQYDIGESLNAFGGFE